MCCSAAACCPEAAHRPRRLRQRRAPASRARRTPRRPGAACPIAWPKCEIDRPAHTSRAALVPGPEVLLLPAQGLTLLPLTRSRSEDGPSLLTHSPSNSYSLQNLLTHCRSDPAVAWCGNKWPDADCTGRIAAQGGCIGGVLGDGCITKRCENGSKTRPYNGQPAWPERSPSNGLAGAGRGLGQPGAHDPEHTTCSTERSLPGELLAKVCVPRVFLI